MSGAAARIRSVYRQLLPAAESSPASQPHIHELSPTYFLPRAAAIEPDANAIVHVNAAGEGVRRSYAELAARAADLAYYLKKQGWKRVGLLMPNTPAHLEAIFGVVAAGGATVPVNYRLKEEDISYILGFGEVECVIVDEEYVELLGAFRRDHPKIPLIVVSRFCNQLCMSFGNWESFNLIASGYRHYQRRSVQRRLEGRSRIRS